jgi:Homeodomain-like domain-containing protein
MRTCVRVRPLEVRTEALRLVAAGVNDCEISRRLGVPRTTIRDWRKPRYVPQYTSPCPRCGWRTRPIALDADDYAELLGLYLGDGHISQLARTQRLRLSLDAAHPRVVGDSDALLRRMFPAHRVGRVSADRGATVVLWVYGSHLSCLFPQAGAGKKHERPIVLQEWQADMLRAAPWSFLRGCIRSDGCAFINRTGRYEYLSYDFHNLSTDILDLFTDTCHALGLRPRRYTKHVRINRREDVALMVQHVGLKG